MRRFVLVMLALVFVLGVSASAANMVINGDFSAPNFVGWAKFGSAEIHNAGDFGMPGSISGGPFSGVVTSWGGSSGGATQIINFTGAAVLTGELFSAAHHENLNELNRFGNVDVLWNGVVVATLMREQSATKWAADYPWVPFEVFVEGTGANELKLQWSTRWAAWTWVGADNLSVETIPVPEPSSMVALASGLFGLVGFGIRRRK